MQLVLCNYFWCREYWQKLQKGLKSWDQRSEPKTWDQRQKRAELMPGAVHQSFITFHRIFGLQGMQMKVVGSLTPNPTHSLDHWFLERNCRGDHFQPFDPSPSAHDPFVIPCYPDICFLLLQKVQVRVIVYLSVFACTHMVPRARQCPHVFVWRKHRDTGDPSQTQECLATSCWGAIFALPVGVLKDEANNSRCTKIVEQLAVVS